MKYYKITFSSKIDKIGENLVLAGNAHAYTCANRVIGLSIPATLSSISEMAVYDCQNIQSISVGDTTYLRPEGMNEIAIRIKGGKYTEKIKEFEEECTVLPFKLVMPLCPEDKE